MDAYIPLVVKYIDSYNRNPEVIKECFDTLIVPRKIMIDTYKFLVYKKDITAIELLSIENKNKLWEECKIYKHREELCKIIHFINETCK